ncbi:MAG: Acyl-coenzyme dehydrogenase [Pseudomonadota bacterium]|jgi:alkylation response protein AidB-like acyl-CoA dehydrogenase
MNGLLWTGIILGLGVGMVWKAPLWCYTLAATLLGLFLYKGQATFSLGVMLYWVILLAFVVVWYAPTLRFRIIEPIFQAVKKQLPPLSDTEYEALQSGDVWKEATLLSGEVSWGDWAQIPLKDLTAEEKAFIEGPVSHLCRLIDDWKSTHYDLDLPVAAWDYLKSEKFFGLIIPKAYGGLGFSAIAHSTVVQKITTHSVAAAVTAMVPNSLGPAELLLHYGTESQKKYYLPRLATGEEIPCFALTGTEVGSDASSIPDTGTVCYGDYQGESVLGIRLSWSKRYITLAPIATLLGLAFKLFDKDGLLGKKEALGITLCLIPTNHPGVEIGQRHFPLNQAFLNGPTQGKDVFIPMEWVIGGKACVGQGWRMLMACLAAGRGISLPALSTGLAKLCYRTTGAYATIREQFHLPIGQFEGIQAGLARIAGHTFLLESMRVVTAGIVDQSVHSSVISGIAKYHATELGRAVMNDAMDIHGGKAIMMGPSNYLARAYESVPISITVEGANIMTRNLLIFGQGVVRCHPYLLDEIQAMNAVAFEEPFLSHLKSILSIKLRLLFHLCTGKYFFRLGHATVCKQHRRVLCQLSFLSLCLRLMTETALLVLGGSLKRKERLSARLGDMFSHLYMAACVVRYAETKSDIKTFVTLSAWALNTCAHRAANALWDFWGNFSWPWLGRVVRRCWFPFGKPSFEPSDAQDAIVAKDMMTLSEARDMLSTYTYRATTSPDMDALTPVDVLEKAFELQAVVAPIWKKIAEALKKEGLWLSYRSDRAMQLAWALEMDILSEAESIVCERYESLRQAVIGVDVFSFNALQSNKT